MAASQVSIGELAEARFRMAGLEPQVRKDMERLAKNAEAIGMTWTAVGSIMGVPSAELLAPT